MKKPTVRINTGEKVLLEEFVKWHPNRQWARTLPIEEYKAKLKGRKSGTVQAVNTPIGQFQAMRDACKALGISNPTLRKYIHNEAYPEYSFVDSSNLISKHIVKKLLVTGKKRTSTPIGVFNSKIDAARAHGLTKGQFERLMQREPKNYFYLSDNINQRKRICKS